MRFEQSLGSQMGFTPPPIPLQNPVFLMYSFLERGNVNRAMSFPLEYKETFPTLACRHQLVLLQDQMVQSVFQSA